MKKKNTKQSKGALLILINVEGFGGAGTSLDADGVRVVITTIVIIVAAIAVAAPSTGQRSPPGEANTAPSPDLTVDVGLSPVLQDGHRVSPHGHRQSSHLLVLRVGQI